MKRCQRDTYLVLRSSSNDQEQQTDEWLNTAAKIREEVRQLELEASVSRLEKNTITTSKSLSRTMEYTEIADSIWTISYRFASDPEPSSPTADSESSKKRPLFGGKITLQFQKDGYTNLLSQESYGSSTDTCIVLKVWGWDIELSKDNEKDASEKDQEYILFSIDVQLPQSDDGTLKERFYFQARINTDIRSGVISLNDGTVTVKRDIVEKSTRWGFFSPSGILAQFRYVGGFVAKAGQKIDL